jgi:SsrA-binding protein
MPEANQIDIKNRKASFEFSFLDKYIAGIQLKGSEIKSIREGKANIADAFCTFMGSELFVRNMNINEFKQGGIHNNHKINRDRKLLLNKSELKKLSSKLKDKGLTIVPLKLFINDKGFAKLEIALAKGKKTHDKRDSIKTRESDRELARLKKR